MSKYFLLAFLLLNLFSVNAQKGTNIKELKDGLDALYNNNYTEAITHLSHASIEPNTQYDIYYGMAAAYAGLNNIDSASFYNQKALSTNLHAIPAQKLAAQIYSQQQNYGAALQQYEQLDSLLPLNDSILLNKAICLYKLNEPEKALSNLRKVLVINPKQVGAYEYLGRCYYSLNKYFDALQALEKAILFDPKNADLLFLQASCFNKLDDKQQARILYQSAYSIDPSNTNIATQYAISLWENKELDKALSIFKSLNQQDPEKEFYAFNTAALYSEKENFDSAIVYYKQVLKINPANEACDEALAAAYYRKALYKLALPYYEKLQQQSNTATVNNLIGLCYLGERNYVKAQDFFKQAILIDKNFAIAYYNLGRTLYAMEDYQAALAKFENYANLQANDRDAYYYLAKTQQQLGNKKSAITNYEHVLQMKPDKDLQLQLADMYFENEQYDQAIEAYQNLLTNDSQSVKLYARLGRSYTAQKQFSLALAMYAKAKEYSPVDYDKEIILAMGNNYLLSEDYKNAAIYIEQAIAMDANFAKAYYLLAYVRFNQGKTKESKMLFAKANSMDADLKIPAFIK